MNIKYNFIKLEIARLRKGWTRKRLAELAGVSLSTVSRVEQGIHSTPKSVKALADALGLEMVDIVEVEEVA